MRKELAYRENDGIAVTLFWHSGTNSLSVVVHDWRNGDWFESTAARARTRWTSSSIRTPTRPRVAGRERSSQRNAVAA